MAQPTRHTQGSTPSIDRRIKMNYYKAIHLRPDPFSATFDEVPIGTGELDYVSLLRLIDKLPADTPAMIEHLPDEATFRLAADAVRGFAKKAGVLL